MTVSAFILAGGKSSRMGKDKAFLQLQGTSLLERALSLAKSVSQDVYVVGSRAKFARSADTLEDTYPDHGPLGGIHAALSHSRTELNLILAVDIPFLRPEFLHYLLRRALNSAAMVTVPRIADRFQPLCAVYRKAFREHAEGALQNNRNRIDLLFSPEDTCVIEESELLRLSFPASMFENLNTEGDYRRAVSLEHTKVQA